MSINAPTVVPGFPITYKTAFKIKIKNPSKNERFQFSKSPGSLMGQPQGEIVETGTEITSRSGAVPFQNITVIFLTSEKVEESDFGNFSVTSLP